MWVHEGCKRVTWKAQGVLQCTDFLVLKLRGCDLVLGVQWMRDLGPITWDFSKLTMQFSMGVQNVVLQGMSAGAI